MKLAPVAIAWCAASAALAQHEVRLERIATVTADGGNTMAAAFAPNGTALAMGGERGDLLVLELPARTRRWFATPGDHWIGTLAFSPDGGVLACCGSHLTLHDAATGRELDRWSDTGPRGFAWNADGSRYAFAHHPGLTMVDAKTRATTTVDFEYPVNALSYSADGTLFVGDNVGRLWRLESGAPAPELLFGHRTKESDMVSAVAVAWAGGMVFDVASGGPLRRGEVAFEVPGHAFAFGVSPDGRSFAAGGSEPRVRWWREGGAKSSDLATSDKIAALAVHPDGRTLFVSTYDGHQELRRDDGTAIALPGHAAMVGDCALSPDGSVLAIEGGTWSMRTWSMQPVLGGAPRRLPGARKVRAGRRGSELLVQYANRLVLVDGNTGVETVAVETAESFHLSDSVLGPGQRLLCCASGEWIDLATKARTNVPERLRLPLLGACEVASARNGTWAIGVCSDLEIYYGALWVTNAEGQTLHANEDGPVYWLTFAPDGKRLYYTRGQGVTFPPDRVLCVRDTADFRLLHEVRAPIDSWRFLDEGHALAAANGLLQVWDPTTLRPVQTVATDEPVQRFESSDDCRILASSNGREVLVYRLHRGD